MKTLRAILIDLLLVALAVFFAALVLAIGLKLGGYPALDILSAWVRGGAGTREDFLVSLKNACPLILTGLAAGVAFRSGVFNIGAEGQSILGAIAGVALATRLLPGVEARPIGVPLALAAAALGGAAWAFVAALLDRARGVPIVLSTILLNFIALKLLGALLEGPLKARGTDIVQSDILGPGYALPLIVSTPAPLHIGFLIALFLAAAIWLLQARTTFGFELLITGLNPVAARYAGMPVAARQFAIMLLSGALAGIAGMMQVMGIEGRSLGPTPVAYGYAGIAVALLGRLHPAGIVLAAVFFGMLDRGASNVEFDTQLPHELADIVKGLMVLVILVLTAYVARRRSVPAAPPPSSGEEGTATLAKEVR
jgi:simple sugar transport system permease protein